MLHSFSTSNNIELMPVQQAIPQISTDLEKTIALTSSLNEYLAKQNFVEARKSFVQLKRNYKQIEFFLLHFDYQMHSRYINGAPLPKIIEKMNELTILEPQGLQIIEEKLFDEQADFKEIAELIHTFEFSLNEVFENLKKNKFTDADIFEAMRFGVIYLYSMGLTGFDSPSGPEKTNEENQAFLEGIHKAFLTYQPYIEKKHFLKVEKLFQDGNQIFNKYKFDQLDRLGFLKNIADPLFGELLLVQRELHIEEPNQRGNSIYPVNYGSISLFDNDFLNKDFFLNSIYKGNANEVIELGRILFYDPILSSNNQRACASCHHPEKAFTDGLKTSLTTGNKTPGLRNAPTILNAVYSTRFFHDVRSDDLLTQIDHVVLNTEEFNTDYITLCNKLMSSVDYQHKFENAFGTSEINASKLKFAITQFVGSQSSFNSSYDRYLRNETTEFSTSAKRGYNLFTGKATCATCHFAPTFSGLVPPFYQENESEVLGVPSNNKAPYILDSDLGRYANGIIQEQAPFYKFSFKTPSLRNIELTAPYMHNGVFATLEEVMDFYNEGGGSGLGMEVPHQTLPEDKLNLTKKEINDIIEFMKTLTDTSKLTQAPKTLPKFPDAYLNKRTIGGDY
jgi:cytochrome c peroxidase